MPEEKKPVCITAEIVPSKGDWFNYKQAYIEMHMSDGQTIEIPFYDDEIHFTRDEVIGKTREEVDALFIKKDGEYLRS